jgi:peptidoglycan-associated lipoprotein
MRLPIIFIAFALASPGLAQPLPTKADLLRVSGTDTIRFEGDSYALTPQARATLTAQAQLFIANPALTATIEGHSDQRDPRDHALAAGERRASAVRDFLVSLGVEANRLTVVSWGRERPNPAAWTLNRRAVVILDKPVLPPPPPPLGPALPPPIPPGN